MKILLIFILNIFLVVSKSIDAKVDLKINNEKSFKDIQDAVDFILGLIKGNPEEVCYKEYKVGCFSTDGPLGHIHTLPQDPKVVDVKFLLYTKSNKQTPIEIHYLQPETLNNVPKGTKLAFIIHGRDSSAEDFNEIKDALLQAEYETVINVDWKKGAKPSFSSFYLKAMANSELVGRQVAVLVNKIIYARHINPKNVYIIGHSLGAHAAGFAGKWSLQKYHWRFGRITGLDAAGPLFENFKGSHLSCEDADNVDAIHTSIGGNILFGEIGFSKPFADVDFYPNGGRRQPECAPPIFDIACNHHAAINYYNASITARAECEFKAYKCESWDDFKSNKCDNEFDSIMGYEAFNYRQRSKHYLKTTKKYPYCNINKSTKINNNS